MSLFSVDIRFADVFVVRMGCTAARPPGARVALKDPMIHHRALVLFGDQLLLQGMRLGKKGGWFSRDGIDGCAGWKRTVAGWLGDNLVDDGQCVLQENSKYPERRGRCPAGILS